MNQKPMPAQGPVDVNVGRHTPGPWEVVAGDDYRIEAAACVELQDAMDLNYLTGQRPADVLKMRFADIKDGALEVQQGKTTKKLRILLESGGQRTGLGRLIDRVRGRAVSSLFIVATPAGKPLSRWTLRTRFDAARRAAAAQGAQQISVAAERQTQHGMETVTPIQGGVVRRHVIR